MCVLPDHFPDVIGVVGIFQNLISKELFLSNFNFTCYFLPKIQITMPNYRVTSSPWLLVLVISGLRV